MRFPLILLALAVTAPAYAAAPATTGAPSSSEPAVEAANLDAWTDSTSVYLVARIKLTGTDLTQATFLRHSSITTLEDCEKERQAGLTTGWNHYSRYFLKTLKGISYKVDYRCVESSLRIMPFRNGMPLNNFYLITTTGGRLQVEAQRNFFDCRDVLRRRTPEESIDVFCAISSQPLLK